MTSTGFAPEARAQDGGATPRAPPSALPQLVLRVRVTKRPRSRTRQSLLISSRLRPRGAERQTLPSRMPAVTPKSLTRASEGPEQDACPLPSVLVETGEVQTVAVP